MNDLTTNAGGREVEAQRPPSALSVFAKELAGQGNALKSVLPSHIGLEKFQRTLTTAVMQNPDLLLCDRKSLMLAATRAATDGLLPDGREAAIYPFSVREKGQDGQWYSTSVAQYVPMTFGIRKKVLQSGDVVSLEVGVVYERELNEGCFLYDIGADVPLRFRPLMTLGAEDATDDKLVVAYSIARLRNEKGDPYWSVEVMRRFEIERVQESSQTGSTKYRDGKPRVPKGPWADWKPEMWKKTVLKRHSKMLPQSGDIVEMYDREQGDEDRMAQRLSAMLEVQAADPKRLPNPSDAAAAPAGDDERVDLETGEVLPTDKVTGMTEVSEEEARALDQQQEQQQRDRAAPAKAQPKPAATAAKPKADAVPATKAQPQAIAGDDEDKAGARNFVKKLVGEILAAPTLAARDEIITMRESMITRLESTYPDLHEEVVLAKSDWEAPKAPEHGQGSQGGWDADAPAENAKAATEPERGVMAGPAARTVEEIDEARGGFELQLEQFDEEYEAAETVAKADAVQARWQAWIDDLLPDFPDLHERALLILDAPAGSGPAASEAVIDQQDVPIWRKEVDSLMADIPVATSLAAWKKLDQQWLKIRAGVPDEGVQGEVDRAIMGRRQAIVAAAAK